MAAVPSGNLSPYRDKKSRRIHEILRLFIGDTSAHASIDDDVINHA
jgi:hypothetical protein